MKREAAGSELVDWPSGQVVNLERQGAKSIAHSAEGRRQMAGGSILVDWSLGGWRDRVAGSHFLTPRMTPGKVTTSFVPWRVYGQASTQDRGGCL